MPNFGHCAFNWDEKNLLKQTCVTEKSQNNKTQSDQSSGLEYTRATFHAHNKPSMSKCFVLKFFGTFFSPSSWPAEEII